MCATMSSTSRDEPLLNATVLRQIAADDVLTPVRSSGRRRSLLRTPKALAHGSLWGSTFNMCSAILGAGALSLPHAVAAMGLVPALTLLLATAVATHYSVVLLIHCIDATGTQSFEDLTRQTFGRINGRMVELSIIVFQYGTLVAYTVAIGDILEPLAQLPAVAKAMPWLRREYIITMFWAVIMLPLSFVERISALQFTSLFGVLALLYLVTAVAIHFAADAAIAPQQTVGQVRYATLSEGAVSAAAIIMFAFTCQVNVPSLYAALADRSPRTMRAVSLRAVCLCLTCYLLVGLTGYLDFPSSKQGNLLKNYCLLDPSITSASDAPPRVMTAAYVAITLTIVMAYPVNVFPTRYTIDVAFLAPRLGTAHACARHTVLTIAIATTTLLTALIVPDISVVFALMGGSASAYVCYVIPAAAAWKLRARIPQVGGSYTGRIGCIALFLFGLIVGTLSTGSTIASLFATPPTPPPNACNTTWDDTHGGDALGLGDATPWPWVTG